MTNNILFPCLDGRRTLYVDIAGSNNIKEIKVHPECTFIATANIGPEYAGTGDIDLALENRFIQIGLDYIPEDKEIQVLNNRTGVSYPDATKIVTLANKIRAKYKEGDVSKGISIRETLETAEMVMDGFEIIEAIQYTFCEKFSQNKDEYDYIKVMVMGS